MAAKYTGGRKRGTATGIEYHFRKLPDGTWQRREHGQRWLTLVKGVWTDEGRPTRLG